MFSRSVLIDRPLHKLLLEICLCTPVTPKLRPYCGLFYKVYSVAAPEKNCRSYITRQHAINELVNPLIRKDPDFVSLDGINSIFSRLINTVQKMCILSLLLHSKNLAIARKQAYCFCEGFCLIHLLGAGLAQTSQRRQTYPHLLFHRTNFLPGFQRTRSLPMTGSWTRLREGVPCPKKLRTIWRAIPASSLIDELNSV